MMVWKRLITWVLPKADTKHDDQLLQLQKLVQLSDLIKIITYEKH